MRYDNRKKIKEHKIEVKQKKRKGKTRKSKRKEQIPPVALFPRGGDGGGARAGAAEFRVLVYASAQTH